MKKRILGAAAMICIILIYGSCYKTGELIPQLTCKPDVLNLQFAMYNNFYTIGSSFKSGTPYLKFIYDINRRLINAIVTCCPGTPINQYDFLYDQNNNLVEIHGFGQIHPPPLTSPDLRITYTYPAGTQNSISTTLNTQASYLGVGSGPMYTYNFNAQFQLVSIYIGQTRTELFTYDFGGNLLTDSLFIPDNLGKAPPPGNVGEYYAYSSYDNQINPGRSDRSLQLFLFMYSKNNPTSFQYYFWDYMNLGYNSGGSSGNYTYNIHGYPTHFQGSVFADYTCLMASPIPPGPLAGGN